ncbi:hypothetical protein [Catalinimonas niigatensis]|uniref:hypothetical protein n=1 Tax=Catalinimonas niigatensis TaxID=1397264 RepID=UPI0026668198|nr:hypothetical protein [Catalinimonas niigatensis]WPP51074.1 hypothetical protein PZB72_01530 [Catalinimonas niigatensis]
MKESSINLNFGKMDKMGKEIKTEYRDKLRRFLATPHSTQTYFDLYQEENDDATFDQYTKQLEELLDNLDEGKIENQADLCKEIKALKLPHNQFGC